MEALPEFEFPRCNLYDYIIEVVEINPDEVTIEDFVIGNLWGEVKDELSSTPNVLVDRSRFNADLTPEEVNILAILMKQGWIQRQVTSIENTRMKYSGADFKMTSQANHLAKLMNLLEESRRDSFHMQRLYKRRKIDDGGNISSNWSCLRKVRALDD